MRKKSLRVVLEAQCNFGPLLKLWARFSVNGIGQEYWHRGLLASNRVNGCLRATLIASNSFGDREIHAL